MAVISQKAVLEIVRDAPRPVCMHDISHRLGFTRKNPSRYIADALFQLKRHGYVKIEEMRTCRTLARRHYYYSHIKSLPKSGMKEIEGDMEIKSDRKEYPKPEPEFEIEMAPGLELVVIEKFLDLDIPHRVRVLEILQKIMESNGGANDV